MLQMRFVFRAVNFVIFLATAIFTFGVGGFSHSSLQNDSKRLEIIGACLSVIAVNLAVEYFCHWTSGPVMVNERTDGRRGFQVIVPKEKSNA